MFKGILQPRNTISPCFAHPQGLLTEYDLKNYAVGVISHMFLPPSGRMEVNAGQFFGILKRIDAFFIRNIHYDNAINDNVKLLFFICALEQEACFSGK